MSRLNNINQMIMTVYSYHHDVIKPSGELASMMLPRVLHKKDGAAIATGQALAGKIVSPARPVPRVLPLHASSSSTRRWLFISLRHGALPVSGSRPL